MRWMISFERAWLCYWDTLSKPHWPHTWLARYRDPVLHWALQEVRSATAYKRKGDLFVQDESWEQAARRVRKLMPAKRRELRAAPAWVYVAVRALRYTIAVVEIAAVATPWLVGAAALWLGPAWVVFWLLGWV